MGLSNSSLPPIQQSSWKACQYFILFQLSTFQSDVLFHLYFTFIDLYQCWNKTSWQERQCSKSGDVITDYQIKYPRAPRKISAVRRKQEFYSPPPIPTSLINKVYALFTCKQSVQEQLQLQATWEDSTGHEDKRKGGAPPPLHMGYSRSHQFRSIQHTLCQHAVEYTCARMLREGILVCQENCNQIVTH